MIFCMRCGLEKINVYLFSFFNFFEDEWYKIMDEHIKIINNND